MICPYCRTRNDIGVRFCRKCGSNLQNLKDYTDYVGFGARVCAFSLDALVTLVPAALILWIATDLSIIPILVILFVVTWIYTATLESSSRQATLGKMVAGILLSTLFVLSRSAAALGNILEFAAFVVCGIMYPISFLPVWIRPLSYVLTPTWGAQILRWTVIEPHLGRGFWIGVVMIGVLSGVYMVVGHYLYSRIDYQVRVTASLWRF